MISVKDKYTTFSYYGKSTTILTASIIGFEQNDMRTLSTCIVLESGARLECMGLAIADAISTFEKAVARAEGRAND